MRGQKQKISFFLCYILGFMPKKTCFPTTKLIYHRNFCQFLFFLPLFLATRCKQQTADPLSFWKDHGGTYPNLTLLAQDIFAIPATSASVERVFSQASIAINGRRNRLSGEQFECEVMLKTNKSYF